MINGWGKNTGKYAKKQGDKAQAAANEAEYWAGQVEDNLQDLSGVTGRAEDAAAYVNSQKPLIEKSIEDAAEANANSVEAASDAKQARTIAVSSDVKSTNAEQVASQANTKAESAITQSKEAKQLVDRVVDGSIETGAMDTKIKEKLANLEMEYAPKLAHATQQLTDSQRQQQTLQHGLNVINADVGAPVEFEFKGRTLVPLGNSLLEPGKRYVIADKKTKVIVDGQTVSGIGKFTKSGIAERGAIIRIANFEGKVSGSNVENPHYVGRNGTSTTLRTPSDAWTELLSDSGTTGYGRLSSLDGSVIAQTSVINGGIAQFRKSYNLIEEFERYIGRIPGSNVLDKVSWLKQNLKRLVINIWGMGSSVGGNKANIGYWNSLTWRTHQSGYLSYTAQNLSSTNAKMTAGVTGELSGAIDPNGLVHFIAYAEPSDGVTSSIINIDYVELEIELKSDANFTHPRVPLYEVSDAEYNKIGLEWDDAEVMRRFPATEGPQHLVNPFVMAEGANNVDLYDELSKIDPSLVQTLGYSEIEAQGSSKWANKVISDRFVPNTRYHIAFDIKHSSTLTTSCGLVFYYEYTDGSIQYINAVSAGTNMTYSKVRVKSTAGKSIKRLMVTINSQFVRTVIKGFTLHIGEDEKPFIPRNPSYLYADVKLGNIGDKVDEMFKKDGRWYLRKLVEKDVVLDGGLAWVSSLQGDYSPNHKRVYVSRYNNVWDNKFILLDHNHRLVPFATTFQSDKYVAQGSGSGFFINVPNSETGFPQSLSADGNLFKRYFNGWKYVDGQVWQSVTGNGQTATAQEALETMPTGYTPPKLSYVSSTPETIDITDKVEGDITVDGLTQVEVGSGVIVREKVVPWKHPTNNYWFINGGNISTKLSNKPKTILRVLKNGKPVKYTIYNHALDNISTYGPLYIQIEGVDFDPTAEYTVTYLALDKYAMTTNPVDVLATYARELRAAHDEGMKRLSDVATEVSIMAKIQYDMLVRLKAGGL